MPETTTTTPVVEKTPRQLFVEALIERAKPVFTEAVSALKAHLQSTIYNDCAAIKAALATEFKVWLPGGKISTDNTFFTQAWNEVMQKAGVPYGTSAYGDQDRILRKSFQNAVDYRIGAHIPAEFQTGAPPAATAEARKAKREENEAAKRAANPLLIVDPATATAAARKLNLDASLQVRHAQAIIESAVDAVKSNNFGATPEMLRNQLTQLTATIISLDELVQVLGSIEARTTGTPAKVAAEHKADEHVAA